MNKSLYWLLWILVFAKKLVFLCILSFQNVVAFYVIGFKVYLKITLRVVKVALAL